MIATTATANGVTTWQIPQRGLLRMQSHSVPALAGSPRSTCLPSSQNLKSTLLSERPHGPTTEARADVSCCTTMLSASKTVQLAAARAELATLQEEHKEQEAQLRKVKKRAEQDVESVIHTFDQEMMEREREYQDAMAVYTELHGQITVR